MTPDDRWLAAVWPFVRERLPPAPARVLEVGCGPLGGFVPALLEGGYDAVGVDPEAPDGLNYQQVEVERFDPRWPLECVLASTSLHHVADLDEVLDRLAAEGRMPNWKRLAAEGYTARLAAYMPVLSPVIWTSCS